MDIHRTVDGLRKALASPGRDGRIGLVPTMGALHDGHVALMRRARTECEIVVATIFVNPSQFDQAADLSAYPRDEARDIRLASAAGVDHLFAPSVETVYPPGFATWVDVEGVARSLEGAARPGHFRGVATVCLKLFMIARPQVAYFGQKDAQQVAVVSQMVRDLTLPLTIVVVPTVRDPDGLALSSRNVRLSATGRRAARVIPKALEAGLAAARGGGDVAAAARDVLEGEDGVETDYVEVADFGGRPTLAVAARVEGIRLIDNVPIDGRVRLE